MNHVSPRHRLCRWLLVLAASPAGLAAHPAAERYIPIGQSPGLSGEATYQGRIRRAEEATYTLQIESDDGQRSTVQVTPDSDVWVDRSRRGRPTLDGDFDDCRRGRRVEVLLKPGSGEADWVKVEGR